MDQDRAQPRVYSKRRTMRDLKYKLTLKFLAAFAVVLVFFSVIVYFNIEHRLYTEAEETLQSHVQHEVSHLPHITLEGDSSHTEHGKSIYFRVSSEEGERLVNSFPSQYEQDPLAAISQRGNLVYQVDTQKDGLNYSVEAYYDVSGIHSYLGNLRKTLALTATLLIILSGPIGIFLTRLALRPFGKLSSTASRVTAGNLSYRFPTPEVNDEYGNLVNSFNALLDRLELAFSATSHFALHASHELRTPVSVISGHAEVALRKERPSESYIKTLETIYERSRKLESMLEQLLTLSDISLSPEASLSHFDGVQVIQEVINLESSHSKKKSKIDLIVEGSPLCYGNPELFRIIVRNLITNATKYSTEKINFRWDHLGPNVSLKVENDGKLNRSTDLEALLRPFERSQNPTSTPGHGLGLSIVQACVNRLRGTISLAHSPMGGLRVDLLLPQATSPTK